MRTTRIAAVALASTAMVAGVASAAVAGHATNHDSVAPNPAGHARTAHPDLVSTTPHTLKQTYFSQGSAGGATVAGGFQTVDGVTTVKCTKPCVIDDSESVQQLSSATSNLFALTMRVDGSDQTAPYQGYAPSSTFGATSWHTVSEVLPKGTHTVQTVIYTDQGTTLYNYSNTYRVFQP